MDLEFYKLHCVTEDYILINTIKNPELRHEHFSGAAKAMCRRGTGIGGEGVIYLTSTEPEITAELYVPDGSPGKPSCGAAFALSRYLFDSGITGTESFSCEMTGTPVKIDIIDSRNFRASLGQPRSGDGTDFLVPDGKQNFSLPLLSEGKKVMVAPVFFDELFLVHITNEASKLKLKNLSDRMSDNGREKTQPVFLFIKNRDEGTVRLWRRKGARFDFGGACGAAVVSGVMNGLFNRETVITCRKKTVFVQWLESNETIYITAPPEYVFSGNYEFSNSSEEISI